MQRDSAVPRPIQRNINATAADLDMNWRRGAPAPAPAPAAPRRRGSRRRRRALGRRARGARRGPAVRKKKLSSLKKRILLERAALVRAPPEARPAPTIRDEATSGAFADATGVGRRFVVRVDNVATRGELEDAEERDEILRDPVPGDAVAVVLGGALGGVDAGDADEVDEALSDLRAVVEARAPALLVDVAARGADVLATFGSARAAAKAAAALAGVVLGGEPFAAAVATADGAPPRRGARARPAAPAAPDTYTDARGQLVKLPPKYAAARHVPKVPNAAPVQPYATAHPLDRTLDGLVAALLARLFEFQERVRLNDPIKAKMRRRLVFGLREVRRGIRADNVKVVVVAPNIDEGSTLAKSVDEILAAARDMGVPVVFALGKRKLGRALRKSVGVSAVGVYSGDGAYDEYRAVTNRLKELQRDPACAVDPAFVQEQRQRGRGAEPKPDGAPPRTDQADAPSAKRPRGRRKAPQTQPAKPPAPSFDFQPPLPGAAQQPPPQLWPAPYVAF
ncbi:hypothetical protein JL720_10518 [Aureococcus anophagefferens]|nr:hypothetical protein JL720_10518 [Aureococcus anophagefferens]